jgi:hypothetical protein
MPEPVKNSINIYLYTFIGIILSLLALIIFWTVFGYWVDSIPVLNTTGPQNVFLPACVILPIAIITAINVFIAMRKYRAKQISYSRSHIVIIFITAIIYSLLVFIMSQTRC